MGAIKTIKDAIKALLEAGVPTRTVVLVGVAADSVDVQQYPSYVVLVPERLELGPNLVIGGTVQEEHWTWGVHCCVGFAGQEEDAIDEVDTLLAAVETALDGKEPDSTSGPLECRVRADLQLINSTRVIYRQEWYHFRTAG